MTFNYQEVDNDRHVGVGSGAVCNPEDILYINTLVHKAEALWPKVAPYLELHMGGEWWAFYQESLARQVQDVHPLARAELVGKHGHVWAFIESFEGWHKEFMRLSVPYNERQAGDMSEEFEEFILLCYKAMLADNGVWAPESI